MYCIWSYFPNMVGELPTKFLYNHYEKYSNHNVKTQSNTLVDDKTAIISLCDERISFNYIYSHWFKTPFFQLELAIYFCFPHLQLLITYHKYIAALSFLSCSLLFKFHLISLRNKLEHINYLNHRAALVFAEIVNEFIAGDSFGAVPSVARGPFFGLFVPGKRNVKYIFR